MQLLHRSTPGICRPGLASRRCARVWGPQPGLIQTRREGCGQSAGSNPLLAAPGVLRSIPAARITHDRRNQNFAAVLGPQRAQRHAAVCSTALRHAELCKFCIGFIDALHLGAAASTPHLQVGLPAKVTVMMLNALNQSRSAPPARHPGRNPRSITGQPSGLICVHREPRIRPAAALVSNRRADSNSARGLRPKHRGSIRSLQPLRC